MSLNIFLNRGPVILLVMVFISFHTTIYAQVVLEQLHSIAVRDGSNDLTMPWTGGLNSVQYNRVDVDGDSKEELVLYDRSAEIFVVFQEDKERWSPAFHLSAFLPEVQRGWVLFVDYNLDGKKDMFTYGDRGVIVYQNVSIAGQAATWKKVADPVYTTGFSGKINLIVNAADVPAITDIDGDGDVDILVYNFAIGGYIRYNKNLSMEMYGHADSLEYEIKTRTWGEFEECTCNEFAFNGETCADLANGRVMHPGGKALLAIDTDGDGDKDLLAGHEQCTELYFFENMGDRDSAFMTGVSVAFPDEVNPANFHIFPSAFYEDVDFDGNRDLLVTPGFGTNYEFGIDFAHSNRYYKNTGTDEAPVFSFQKSNFIQSETIDLGEYSVPLFIDLDSDGLMDLLIAANGYMNGETFSGYVAAFRNTGTDTNPAFTKSDGDFLNLSSIGLMNPIIGLADLSGDKVADLVYTALNTSTMKLECRYFINRATNGKAPLFSLADAAMLVLPATTETGDSPTFFDVDQDGNTDLLLGKRNGALEYYKNRGSNNFTLADGSYLGIERDFELQRLDLVVAVADMDGNNKPDLVATDSRGLGRLYFDFQSQADNDPQAVDMLLKDTMDVAGSTIPFDSKSWIAPADLFGLGTESLIAGGVRGGVQVFKNPEIGQGAKDSAIVLSLFPNPITGSSELTIRADRELRAQVYTLLGQQVMEPFVLKKYQDTVLATAFLRNGMYILTVMDQSGNSTAKLFMVLQ